MNLPAAFSPLPSAGETWARLDAFVTHWWRAPGMKDGFPSAELDRASLRLNVALPSAVRNAYCFFGRYPEITRGDVTLLSPAELHFLDGVLVLCADEEQRVFWGVQKNELSREDPPVVMRSERERREGSNEPVPEWLSAASRFTAYFTENALFQAIESAPWGNSMEYTGDVHVPGELVKLSTDSWTRPHQESTLYGGDDVLVLIEGPPPEQIVYVAARTEELYARTLDFFPDGEWQRDQESAHRENYAELLESYADAMELLRSAGDSNLFRALSAKKPKP